MPEQYSEPSSVLEQNDWFPAIVPGTVAQSMRENQLWSLDDNLDFDDFDWWYQCQFEQNDTTLDHLILDGLSGIANIWLNEQLILHSDNMFITHQVNLKGYLQANNTLVIQFKAINSHIRSIRSRPRWKTKLVKQQKLRHIRTTLLGRIPGWTPKVAAIGPFKSIKLVSDESPISLSLQTELNNGNGIVSINASFSASLLIEKASLIIDGITYPLSVTTQKNHDISDSILIEKPELWWPHTHGEAKLYNCQLVISTANKQINIPINDLGFKEIKLDQTEGKFSIAVNDQTIFCRGACWTVNDCISINGDIKKLRNTLTLMRDAGANMIRCIGTMVYEQDDFYSICDELGILVWQDFMFANMDYPFDDESFLNSVTQEVKQQLNRLNAHPCLTIYCGNSEIEQQVSMLGFDNSVFQSSFFHNLLPEIVKASGSTAKYVSSSPTGGERPFRTNEGLSHYYGIGAYLRPLSELRNHNVQFTSECLGFANIPSLHTRNEVMDGEIPVCHNPRWKKNTPRDSGTGWDFEDVRDHYLEKLYKVDSTQLRSFDPERYMKLSELVTSQIMHSAFSEWRSNHSNCHGAIVWFLNDLTPGAGWGILDSYGLPKAAYYHLKRIWQSVSLVLTDESINGIDAHIFNEQNNSFEGNLLIKLYDELGTETGHGEIEINLSPRSSISLKLEEVLQSFCDINYSYRFGPPKHQVVDVKLYDSSRNDYIVAEANYFIDQSIQGIVATDSVTTQIELIQDKNIKLTILSDKPIYGLSLDVKGFLADDNYFNLMPNVSKTILLHPQNISNKFRCYLNAINMKGSLRLTA